MNSVDTISISQLLLLIIPITISLCILFYEKVMYKYTLYAFTRMITQLIFIGFFLRFIFTAKGNIVVLLIIVIMSLFSAFISVRTIKYGKRSILLCTFIIILLVGGLHIAFLTQVVLNIRPCINISIIVPLSGMIFANCINGISLAIDRYIAEYKNGNSRQDAEKAAFHTALIPITNSFLSVGIVSLPGLMTGQILSGVSPLIAVRYQIIIFSMIFSTQVCAVFLFIRCMRRLYKVQ